MGLRYTIPFKGGNISYLVEISQDGYVGQPEELTGARSCFVVSGTDDDFMYVPIRTSTATINVIDSDLLLGLYSINNQHASVKLYKDGALEWTGYIKPEQFTQPYLPTPQNINVECVSPIATLEHMEYKDLTTTGNITIWDLLKHLVTVSNGGYNGVYIPAVYGSSSSMSGNVLEEIELLENNFLKEEMNLLEVMKALCKFLNWTLYDIKGSLYFVDADWNGSYRLYDASMTEYTLVRGEDVVMQDVGYRGSDSNTLDVINGYNKAKVKSINNVFDDVVKDEDYDSLKAYNESYYVSTYKDEGSHAVRKKFLKPEKWNLCPCKDLAPRTYYSDEELSSMTPESLNKVLGSLLISEADYECVSSSNPEPAEGVTDFNYVDTVQIRVASTSSAQIPTAVLFSPALIMRGEHAVYADCAISIDGTFETFFDDTMSGPSKKTSELSRSVTVVVSCGGKWYDGSAWVSTYATIAIEVDAFGKIKSNRTPFTPYKDISGYVIPMDFFVGEPEITILCPVWLDDNGTHYNTGVKIRNLKFGYAKKEGVVEEGENGDRLYENIVNEDYMSECEEVSFEIGSYNADGATYSKAIMNGSFLTDNLYCAIVNGFIRPEELMIRRIVNRYSETKIKLTESINMTDLITPLSSLSDTSMVSKRFRMTSGSWDYEQNRLTVQMQEDINEGT